MGCDSFAGFPASAACHSMTVLIRRNIEARVLAMRRGWGALLVMVYRQVFQPRVLGLGCLGNGMARPVLRVC